MAESMKTYPNCMMPKYYIDRKAIEKYIKISNWFEFDARVYL
jgi:hypothetical protein